MNDLDKERLRLEAIAQHFSMKDGFNGYMNKYRVSKILELCKGETVLDIGSADAFMAEALAPFFKRIVALDGSATLVQRARERLCSQSHVEVIHAMVEEFETPERFDLVLLSFILEHVTDPIALVVKAARFVKLTGTVFVMVPNAYSLHRRVGVAMGLLTSVDDFSESDKRQGHRRVYTEERLRTDLEAGRLCVDELGTFFIKPLSNAQMEQLDPQIANAFFMISQDLPGLGSMIYAKCYL